MVIVHLIQHEGTQALKMPEDSVPGKMLRIVLWFILPLLVLTVADRLWAWTRFVKRKTHPLPSQREGAEETATEVKGEQEVQGEQGD